MGQKLQKLLDVDADDLFAYKASRRVVIRDRRLGITRMLIVVGLFFYVVVYEVIMRRGYLEKDEPVGFVTMSVRRNGGTEDRSHCCPGACDGEERFGSKRGRLECVGWDRHNMVFPSSEERSVFVTTRVRATHYAPLPSQCIVNASVDSCPSWETESEKNYYTTGVEGMTIMLDHAVYGKTTKTIVKSQQMDHGSLNNAEGTVLSFCGGTPPGRGFPSDRALSCADSADRNRPGDIFSVAEMLSVAGVSSLNRRTQGLDGNPGSDTLRYDGLVLLIVLTYSGHGVDAKLRYDYRVFPIEGMEFFSEETRYDYLPGEVARRVVFKRHGLRIVAVPSGYLARFSFVELMKTLTIALGLLSIARFVVEQVLIRFLPFASVYKRYRDVKTVDFSEYDHSKVKDLDDAHFAFGELRAGGTLNPDAEEEKAPGQKLHEKVQEMKEKAGDPPSFLREQHHPPPYQQMNDNTNGQRAFQPHHNPVQPNGFGNPTRYIPSASPDNRVGRIGHL